MKLTPYTTEQLARALEGKRLPLTRSRTLEALAKMQGFPSWNHAAKTDLSELIKKRAKTTQDSINLHIGENGKLPENLQEVTEHLNWNILTEERLNDFKPYGFELLEHGWWGSTNPNVRYKGKNPEWAHIHEFPWDLHLLKEVASDQDDNEQKLSVLLPALPRVLEAVQNFHQANPTDAITMGDDTIEYLQDCLGALQWGTTENVRTAMEIYKTLSQVTEYEEESERNYVTCLFRSKEWEKLRSFSKKYRAITWFTIIKQEPMMKETETQVLELCSIAQNLSEEERIPYALACLKLCIRVKLPDHVKTAIQGLCGPDIWTSFLWELSLAEEELPLKVEELSWMFNRASSGIRLTALETYWILAPHSPFKIEVCRLFDYATSNLGYSDVAVGLLLREVGMEHTQTGLRVRAKIFENKNAQDYLNVLAAKGAEPFQKHLLQLEEKVEALLKVGIQ